MTPATARSAGGTGIERLNPPELFDPSGLGFSSVVIAPSDRRLVYIAGKLADGPDSDFEQQVRGSFDLLDQALRTAHGRHRDRGMTPRPRRNRTLRSPEGASSDLAGINTPDT